jgi:hypothetical protein
MKPFALLSIVFAVTAAAPRALAQDALDDARRSNDLVDRSTAIEVDRRETMWRVEMGYRGSFVTDAGYNPFSTQDYFSQFSLAGSRTLVTRRQFSFAAGIAWEYGSSDARAREDAASFSMHRLAVPLEGRMHFGGWGYAFLRAAPGLATQRAEIDDPSASAPLTKTLWLFSTDVSAGYAWLLWPRAQPAAVLTRLWLQSDVGYGWVAAERLTLVPDPSSSSQHVTAVDLGTLAMQGAFFRIAVAASF